MMDKKGIKDTGILEQYLLGELSETQQTEVELALKEDADLHRYYKQLEEDFEKLAFENAITPPAHIKKPLLNAISEPAKDSKTITLQKKTYTKTFLAIAASLAVLFMISSSWLYMQWQQSKNTLELVQNETNTLTDRIVALEQNLDQTNRWYNAINNPNTIQLVLKGNQISPASNAITYVNHKNKTVLINAKGLAVLDDLHTYQMWADVEGEMINMGVIQADQEMIAMKYIDHAESINITIEPKGGSDHPTVERLIGSVLL